MLIALRERGMVMERQQKRISQGGTMMSPVTQEIFKEVATEKNKVNRVPYKNYVVYMEFRNFLNFVD